MKPKDIDSFKKILNQLEGLHEEISTLSKKSYTDSLNSFKLNLVNQVLSRANEILGENYLPFTDFTIFEDANIPNNSDVTLVLSQYINCMESLREENIVSKIEYTTSGSIAKIYWSWKGTNLETYPPKNVRK
ncbi:hypothetical protein [Dyadobacter sp. MSC1_007]|jgi:hypothetical protein|uniref:hypothetical protein n=1 Tax=Dyadobacter sp. MSC1_007 TaxID=2909264 RepID=UPI00202E6AE9|nr:hypothetical protein [Dyadobacter sp. MSC1_007]